MGKNGILGSFARDAITYIGGKLGCESASELQRSLVLLTRSNKATQSELAFSTEARHDATLNPVPVCLGLEAERARQTFCGRDRKFTATLDG